MTDSWSGYPKVYTLGHAAIGLLLDGDVIVQEKFDGSQFSFGLFNGGIRVRSRGRQFDIEAPDKIFAGACGTVKDLASKGLLHDGWTYRGEVIASRRHNALTYDRAADGCIVLFDISFGIESYGSPYAVKEQAAHMGLEPCPLLYFGPGADLDMPKLEDLLKRKSSLGGTTVEGVVIKNYYRFGRDSKVLMGKLVREEFKEMMRQAQPKPKKEMVQELINVYKTEARWAKAVQHLRENGTLLNEPKDIGPLLKEVSTDLLTEEGEAIKTLLFKRFWPEISRGVSRGFADWYKLELAKKQFGEEVNGNK